MDRSYILLKMELFFFSYSDSILMVIKELLNMNLEKTEVRLGRWLQTVIFFGSLISLVSNLSFQETVSNKAEFLLAD